MKTTLAQLSIGGIRRNVLLLRSETEPTVREGAPAVVHCLLGQSSSGAMARALAEKVPGCTRPASPL
jgi:hypothetical protein